eukprot:762934-Hanusia_phi.AAC.2
MRKLRELWRQHNKYRRCKKLWEEYQAVMGDVSVSLKCAKLSDFLDSFQQAFQELQKAENRPDLDNFFGDCSDILIALLDLVDR